MTEPVSPAVDRREVVDWCSVTDSQVVELGGPLGIFFEDLTAADGFLPAIKLLRALPSPVDRAGLTVGKSSVARSKAISTRSFLASTCPSPSLPAGGGLRV